MTISDTRIEPGDTTARAALALAAHASSSPQKTGRTATPIVSNAGARAKGHRAWSEKYPPIGRAAAQDQSNVVGFEHSGGTLNINCIRIEQQTRNEFSWMAEFEPCATSILSALPSFIYHSGEVSVPLTRSEIGRLLRFSLSRGEYFRLVEKFGVFFEICSFFYDEESGEALHPATGDTPADRQRHTQILALTPGAIPPPEPGHMPEDLVAYLNGESASVDAPAAPENDPRPYLLVLVNDDGTVRPHSIMNQAAAYAFQADVKDQTEAHVLALPLLGPANAWRPDPFDNFVAVYRKKDGTYDAYGRFASRKEANKFAPKPEVAAEYMDSAVATVTSSYLGKPVEARLGVCSNG
jgi:hypothetical protein